MAKQARTEVRAEEDARYQRPPRATINGVEAWKSGCHNFYSSPSGRNVVQWASTLRRYYLWARALRRRSSRFRPLPRAAREARERAAETVATR